MDEERFQQLLTALVVKKAREMNPEVYSGEDVKNVIEKLNQNEQDKNQIMQHIKELGESGELEKELMEIEQSQEQTSYLKNGGKLNYLQSLKKGGKIKSKKCSCGCDLVTKKEKGGKLVQSCACGCKPKLENGGKIQKLEDGAQITSVDEYYRKKLNAESQRASQKGSFMTNLANTLSDFFNDGKPSYIPKTQYWYDAKVKAENRLRPKTASVVTTKSTENVTPKTETVPATTQSKPTAETEVPANTTTKTKAQPNVNVSIVDYLNSMGRASDKASRAALAKELGMSSYNFSAVDNLKLLELVKQKGRNTGEIKIERPTLAKPINVPGAIIPAPKVQVTPSVSGLVARQGFPTSSSITDMYTQMYSTPQWLKDFNK